MKKKVITALELAERLAKAPVFLAGRAEIDARRAAKQAEYLAAEAPVVADLQAAGVEITSVWDMVNSPALFAMAQPTLWKHLQFPYPPAVREGIARSMSTTAARPYWRGLVNLYQVETDPRVKDGLAIALSGIAKDGEYAEIIDLLNNVRNGPSRTLLIWVLERRAPREMAVAALESVVGDAEIGEQARISLKKVVAKKR